MRRRYHYLLLILSLLMAGVSLYIIPRVEVNSDMEKYLPDDSQMKQGLRIMSDEFGNQTMPRGDVRIMVRGLSTEEIADYKVQLIATSHVDGVNLTYNSDSTYVLYDLTVASSVDQKSLGKSIQELTGFPIVVETSQDGATPPISVIIIAAVLILVILFLMARSWIEPILILVSTGVAILWNAGSNILLPNLSITTNFIGPILQAVLSLDYCIVIMNRYRQELSGHTDRRSAGLAINGAIRKAFPAILGSALTTIMGLLVLCLMRLKIGMDMGVVLAKGVLCSLICTFTVFPSLLILFRKTILFTKKKAPVIRTDSLSRWVEKAKYPLWVTSVVLFALAFFFSGKTDVYFCTNGESEIDKVFPKNNPIVLLYETAEENKILPLADSLCLIPGVDNIISYPNMLQRAYRAQEMPNQLIGLLDQSEQPIPDEYLSYLSPEITHLLYYLQSGKERELAIDFPELMRFVADSCLDNPLFANLISTDMKQKMTLLQQMMNAPKSQTQETNGAQATEGTADTLLTDPATAPIPLYIPADSIQKMQSEQSDVPVLSLIPIAHLLYQTQPNAETHYLERIVDTVSLRKPMNANEISAFVGSSQWQTKLVFSLDKQSRNEMTPVEYVQLLTKDLFQRKAWGKMVSEEQKKALGIRSKIMHYALQDATFAPSQLANLLAEYGMKDIEADYLTTLYDSQNKTEVEVAVADTVHLPIAEPIFAEPVKTPEEIEAERQAALFYELMYSGKSYRADQMAENFKQLGQHISAHDVSLLYAFYGSKMHPDSRQTMTIEGMLLYVADTLVNDVRLSSHLSDTIRQKITSIPVEMGKEMMRLRNADYSLLVMMTSLPYESEQTYVAIDSITTLVDGHLGEAHYLIGESVMYSEMKNGFGEEMQKITILTILAIFLIIALSFRSVIIPTLLVITVMTAVYLNVIFSGLLSGDILYLAYLIVQSILMGATIDYAILMTNYYLEHRKTKPMGESMREAYSRSISTIMTSGLIMVAAPGVMALLVDDLMISSIVGCISLGAFVAILLIMTLLPGSILAADRFIIRSKKTDKPMETKE